jgi:hypothetical protein
MGMLDCKASMRCEPHQALCDENASCGVTRGLNCGAIADIEFPELDFELVLPASDSGYRDIARTEVPESGMTPIISIGGQWVGEYQGPLDRMVRRI